MSLRMLIHHADRVVTCLPCRYVKYGEVTAKAAAEFRKPEVMEHFSRLVQRVSPKSYAQAEAEVKVTRTFFETFAGDQVGTG
jgi:1-pyrroline-5-carboxylate dehydrogenase